jgi:hypothetical protein
MQEHAMPSSLATRLNLRTGMKLRVFRKPPGLDLDDVVITTASSADGVLAFARTLKDIEEGCAAAITAAQQDRLAWIAYPKAGQLGTDLNRDILWKHLVKSDIEGVRQISIDEVWSAMRFRPAK